jgi:protein-disulfide isomerase
MKTATILLASLSVFAQTKPPAEKSAFDKATIEAYLRNVELYVPVVTAKVDDAKPSKDLPGFFDVIVHWSANGFTKDELVYVSKDGHQVIRGDVYDVNKNPFQGNLDKLKTDNQPAFGPAGAPVTMVVFSDFQCPVCKEEATVLRQNVATTFKDKVRVYFKDYPLEAIHPWAKAAAIAGRCVFKQNPAAFWDYFDWAYENQGAIGLDNFNSKFQTFSTEKGLDGMQLGRCIENNAPEADVTRERDEGRALRVEATPTMFLNGRKLEGSVPWQTVEALINMELEQKAKAAEAADKCCEITLPKIKQ